MSPVRQTIHRTHQQPQSRHHTRRFRALFAALVAGVLVLTASPAQAAAPTYTNDVSASFADTYADPAVIQGKDGWWYAYATADPLRSGGPSVVGHISRTRDWVTWDYVGPIFTSANRPVYATPGAGLWAPDVRYIQGRYVMYFTVTDTTLNAGGDYAIGVATADDPAGPWTPTDAPIIGPRHGGDFNWYNTIDPSGFTDTEGNQYLYFGGYFGGTHVTRLTPDGLTAVGGTTQVGHWDRYEGSYVVEHDGWYYMMASSANCCAGPATGYSVFSGRAKSPMGPFLDKDGRDMNASVTGGTQVVTQNGNRWVGAGHNAMLTDASGRDYLVYHALDKHNAWLNQPGGLNRRPMLIDPIDWVDGWPVVNAGAGPSEGPMPAPVTTSLLSATPWNPADGLSRTTTVADPQGGDSAKLNGTSSSSTVPAGDLRVRLDIKASGPTHLRLGTSNQVKVKVSPAEHLLTVEAGGRTATATLPDLVGWNTLVAEVDNGRLTAYVSASDLAEPSAIIRLDLPGFTLGQGPVQLIGTGLVDNLTAARPAVEATQLSPQPTAGDVLFSDTFTSQLGAGWSWVRPQADVSVNNGLNWPLKSVDIVGGANTGALLLRDAPSGDWIATVKFTLDLGSETNNRNFQQAGLLVHQTDNNFARLGSVSIWGTRTLEYGRELAMSPTDPRLIYGGAIIGPNAPTMWMRIAHHQRANGEHLYRAGFSHDGVTWTWGATMTFEPGTTQRIGLYAGGGANPATVATFHEFTLSRAVSAPGTWPN
ncbi:family 43 glycosylhydrolase [Propionibacteriaceae bacterium G1746]|uniref:family 43 glycosylhydrolase n=1 Tax=Aestuariimicrobium sp. G57 TaxID=3418485 RepID=UPI003C205433